MILQSRKLFERAIYGNIIYNILDISAYMQYLNSDDENISVYLDKVPENRDGLIFVLNIFINLLFLQKCFSYTSTSNIHNNHHYQNNDK